MLNIQLIKEALIDAKKTFDKVKSDKNFSKRLSIGFGQDVTIYFDKEVENTILNRLKDHVNCVLTEESGLIEFNKGNLNAIIDPVDGSINALRGIPFFASSIAIFNGEKFKDAIAAGIINLANGDLFLTDCNKVYFNNVEVQRKYKLDYSEIVAGTDLKVIDVNDPKIDIILKLFKNFRYLRFLGSLALELAYVAVGITDAFIVPFKRIRFLDIAAGLLLIKFAGGYVELLDEDLENLNIFTNKRLAFLVSKNLELGNYIKKVIM
jgi:Archaeal fructose-1,6-bisphosphatase and related enzymes of inositol monophosphatase family